MTNAGPALGESEPDGLDFFTEERIALVTRNEQSSEEAPAIVSVITRAQIERYGARDLGDILRLVPGFELGLDVYSEAGATFRGIWVEEGKSLLMINGIMQNELGYGNYSFIGTIPASMIERVEVIRGPGSAMYGGFAEVDVINVITHQAQNLNGMRVSGDVGVMDRVGDSLSGNISYGAQTGTMKVAAHVGYGTQPLSRREYADFFGNRLRLDENNSYRRWQHVITEATAKHVTLRYQRTTFTFGSQDAFVTIQPPINGMYLDQSNDYTDAVHLDYAGKVTDRLTIQPLFEYNRNNTWNFNYPASLSGSLAGSGNTLWRYRGELAIIYDVPSVAQLRLGGGYIRDEVDSVASDGTPGLQLSSDPADRTNRIHTDSSFGLLQYQHRLNPFGITVGGRYENTSFGDAFAPRAGVTYVRRAFNAKLLYGRAFRIPLPWQAYSRVISFSDNLDPETADTVEMELGYKFTRSVSGKINVFHIDIDDPIVYDGWINRYSNFGKIQSRGIEAEMKADFDTTGGFANLSFSEPSSRTSPGFVTESKKRFLGSPRVKINAGVYYRKGIWEFAPSATYLSSRPGQSQASAHASFGTMGTSTHPALVIANMAITARNIFKDLDMHFTVHNVFDTRYVLIQPVYGGHAALPAQDRQMVLGATWRL